MKYALRLPTDTYAYIEARVDVETPQEAVEAYKELQRAWKGESGSGLNATQWNAWIDSYLQGKAGSIDEWSEMDDFQKKCINEIKKSMKRTNK